VGSLNEHVSRLRNWTASKALDVRIMTFLSVTLRDPSIGSGDYVMQVGAQGACGNQKALLGGGGRTAAVNSGVLPAPRDGLRLRAALPVEPVLDDAVVGEAAA
jgi:hypothetical protein